MQVSSSMIALTLITLVHCDLVRLSIHAIKENSVHYSICATSELLNFLTFIYLI